MAGIIFVLLMIFIFGKIIGFAFQATWGIAKILFSAVFLPLFLIGLVIAGFLYIALPVLIVIGLAGLLLGIFK